MNKPNRKLRASISETPYSISLTAWEWDIIAQAIQAGEPEVVTFIKEVSGGGDQRVVDAKLDKLNETIKKFVTQLKVN